MGGGGVQFSYVIIFCVWGGGGGGVRFLYTTRFWKPPTPSKTIGP